ncbi:MAG: MOSC N-terminal beta barrel domain-containing protein [Bacteroidota bacterium]
MTLDSLAVYPVKSLRGFEPAAWDAQPRGFADDRRWMVVDPAGTFLTQRNVPAMATLAASVSDEALTIMAPDGAALVVPRSADAGHVLVTVWGDTLEAARAGDEADAWLSAQLGRPARLVHMSQRSVRMADPQYAPTAANPVSLADGFPYLVTTTASLTDLNRRLETAGQRPVPMNRFRANLVIDTEEPFEEDRWRELRIGNVRFAVVKPCARCSVITTDQQTGARFREPLRTLARFRRVGSKVLFGMNLVPLTTGRLDAGMPAHVTYST